MTKQLSSLPTSFVRISITHEETVETIIYGREKIGFVKGEKTNFAAGLNCKTLQANLTGFSRRRIQLNYRVNDSGSAAALFTGRLEPAD
jgi:hypothetical protein